MNLKEAVEACRKAQGTFIYRESRTVNGARSCIAVDCPIFKSGITIEDAVAVDWNFELPKAYPMDMEFWTEAERYSEESNPEAAFQIEAAEWALRFVEDYKGAFEKLRAVIDAKIEPQADHMRAFQRGWFGLEFHNVSKWGDGFPHNYSEEEKDKYSQGQLTKILYDEIKAALRPASDAPNPDEQHIQRRINWADLLGLLGKEDRIDDLPEPPTLGLDFPIKDPGR